MNTFKIIKISTIDSTNKFVKELIQKKKINNNDIIWALNQTKGVGQKNKLFISEPFKNLTFSIYKTFKNIKSKDYFLINCITSISVFETLKEYKIPELSIKWSNDILSANKKICGILIENSIKNNCIEKSIIGVGININQIHFKNLPQATSMKILMEKEFNIEQILNVFIEKFKKNSAYTKEKLLYNYQKNLFKKNLLTTFKDDKKNIFQGVIKGVLDNGKLIVECNQKKHFFQLDKIKILY